MLDLSIIIPSFQRADLLEYGLKAIAKQVINSAYEVIVLNDGVQDTTEAVCGRHSTRLPIKYVFTGKRNKDGLKWRIPGFAINIGVKIASGRNIILTCPEIWLLNSCIQPTISALDENAKRLVIPDGKDDRGGIFLNYVSEGTSDAILNRMYDSKVASMHPLNTEYPFFMGINRGLFVDIGGYDEDFIGNCWDDLDIVTRLKNSGCEYYRIQARIVHLYHPRLRYGSEDIKAGWKYNEDLFRKRIMTIKRNENREWGVLGA